ncbi:MAG: DeoR/GlpR family DNA-binding transcription regulator [Roseibium sp.]|uniref:DeoR/GlpR family DNA-binding transcription regulator n=1 Tax=Roseibium sp. TaxID=1936156 RepID=UPI00261DD8A2|nr:DeoR/GlpR family DNA-binding transcription regulator [Roseibium sp.]MCV0427073.1 DeoR/GlpR family DNA-binding transcription regulator [Roseibium sp.]
MLPDERYAVILEEVNRHPAVSIRSLTARLGVSRETVRKDIEILAGQGKLLQVRGGAAKVVSKEAPMTDRVNTNAEGKIKIATRVSSMIPEGASIIIDNGSTTLEVARELVKHRKELQVVTNDLRLAETIAPACREVVLAGGRIDPSEMATFGLEVIENLSRYRAEFAIISAGGLSAHAGLTDFTREAADLRARMLVQAETALILADSSKFGVVGQIVMPAPPGRAILISDADPPADISQVLSELQIDTAHQSP